jgi:hypothetical protein
VIIEDGVGIKRSIVANDAVILTNTTLDNGCIVSFGVSVLALHRHADMLAHRHCS